MMHDESQEHPGLRESRKIPVWAWAAAALCVAAVLTYYYVSSRGEAKEQARLQEIGRIERAAEDAAQRQIEEERRARIAEHAQSNLDSMLDNPSPADVIEACLGAVHRLPHELGGWYLSGVDCDSEGAALGTYTPMVSKQDRATLASFRSAVERAGLKGQAGWFDSNASVRLPAPPLAQRSPPKISSLPSPDDASARLSAHGKHMAESYDGVSVRAEPPAASELPSIEGQRVPPEYQESRIRISGTGLWSMPDVAPSGANVTVSRVFIVGDEQKRWSWVLEGRYFTALD